MIPNIKVVLLLMMLLKVKVIKAQMVAKFKMIYPKTLTKVQQTTMLSQVSNRQKIIVLQKTKLQENYHMTLMIHKPKTQF